MRKNVSKQDLSGHIVRAQELCESRGGRPGVQAGAVDFRGVCTFAASGTVHQGGEKKEREKKGAVIV